MPPKRKCTFNCQLQTEYPFIKKTCVEWEVRCNKCASTFSIAHGGRSDITSHIATDKHKRADNAAASTSLASKFFRCSTMGPAEQKLAATEGAWAYHTVNHNHSFRSTDCTSKLVQKCFEAKYGCARTKTEAIVSNVLAPFAAEELENDLKSVNYVTLFTDSSNHQSTKVFPILVRYFKPDAGVYVKILELTNLNGETAEIVSNYLTETITKHKLDTKVVGLCADNTNSNFGGAARLGKSNVYRHLEKTLKRSLIGVGCAAHIMNNAVQSATDCLPIDVQSIVVKIYSYFHIYTVRVESLKEFCEFVQVEYHQLLGYCKTRWLALAPAVGRFLEMFAPLKSYFLSQSKCPTAIKNFFSDPMAEMWLRFAHSQSATFHSAVLQIEGQNTSMIEVATALNELKAKLIERRDNVFFTSDCQQML